MVGKKLVPVLLLEELLLLLEPQPTLKIETAEIIKMNRIFKILFFLIRSPF